MADRTDVSWPFLVAIALGRGYRALLLTLALVTLVPFFFGFGSHVLRSGSMEPSISAGDVVVARDIGPEDEVDVGRVYVYRDPAESTDRLVVHRIVDDRDDGAFVTAGDANQLTDHEPLPRDHVEGRGIWLVPFIGKPVVWVSEGAWGPFLVWLLVTIGLFVLASRNIHGEPPKWTPLRLIREHRAMTTAGVVVLGLGVVYAAQPAVVDARLTDRTANGSSTWEAGAGLQPYVAAVLTDAPFLLWLLDEEGGDWAQDRSGNAHTGRYVDLATYRAPGALPNNFGYAVRLGPGARIVDDGAEVGAPDTFTLELWFRTTTTTGGRLLGFESTADPTSKRSDRTVHMSDDGRIVYGGWDVRRQATVTTPTALNDGQWHHLVVVASPQGAGQVTTLYVDGATVTSGETSATKNYTGWWRVGDGTPLTGPSAPSTTAFEGLVDNVAVYHTALSAGRVAAHHDAR